MPTRLRDDRWSNIIDPSALTNFMGENLATTLTRKARSCGGCKHVRGDRGPKRHLDALAFGAMLGMYTCLSTACPASSRMRPHKLRLSTRSKACT